MFFALLLVLIHGTGLGKAHLSEPHIRQIIAMKKENPKMTGKLIAERMSELTRLTRGSEVTKFQVNNVLRRHAKLGLKSSIRQHDAQQRTLNKTHVARPKFLKRGGIPQYIRNMVFDIMQQRACTSPAELVVTIHNETGHTYRAKALSKIRTEVAGTRKLVVAEPHRKCPIAQLEFKMRLNTPAITPARTLQKIMPHHIIAIDETCEFHASAHA
jgi:hypothetical protein